MPLSKVLLLIFIMLLTTNVAIAAENVQHSDINKEAAEYSNPSTQLIKDQALNMSSLLAPSLIPGRDDRGGPDDFGYRWLDVDEDNVNYQWLDITQGEMQGRNLNMGNDDQNSGALDFGWNFPFYGREYNSIRVCTNGWASFTNNTQVWTPQGQFPNGNDPEALIAPLFTDLYPPAGGAIWFYTNADDRIAVISWINIAHISAQDGPRFTFQFILTGNGRIKMQYNNVPNIPNRQCSIGIQNADRNIGLSYFFSANANQVIPQEEFALVFSAAMGSIAGIITDLATEEPIEGALITLSDGTEAVTDEEGGFLLEDILEDSYTLTVSAFGYNSVTSDEFEVLDEEITEVNIALPHPEIRVNREEGFAHELARNAVQDDGFTIFNDGNGPLEFNMKFSIPVDRDDPGDEIFRLHGSEITGDQRLRGITAVGDIFYLTGSNNVDNPNYVYVVNLQGELVRHFEQPVDNPSAAGMRGITNDGTYLYSADGSNITQFTLDGERVATIRSPINPTTFLTYDPETQHLWVASTRTRFFEIDLEGNVISQVDNPVMRVYGIAWHPQDLDGHNLYVFQRLAVGSQAMISKVNPQNGHTIDVLSLTDEDAFVAVDCDITDAFNPLIWMFTALTEENVSDFIMGAELELNTSWIGVDPMQGVVEAESSLDVDLRFDSGDWLPGAYELVLIVEHNASTPSVRIPLTMVVTEEEVEMEFYEFIQTPIRHNFTITAATFDNQRMPFGSEIGVFTSDMMCVGGSVWFDRATIVPAYGDNPDTDMTDGFIDDDTPIFRIYDARSGRDYAADFIYASGDRYFRSGGSTRGALSIPEQERSLEFDLNSGWYLISASLIFEDNNVINMFEELVERESLELLKDGRGRFYRPDFGFNNIPFWNSLEGYHIKLRRAEQFVLNGGIMDPTTPIPLAGGWNTIAYLPRFEMDAPTAFAPLDGNLLIAKDGLGRFYLPEFEFTNMGNLSEKNGYQVKVEEETEFRYPQAVAARSENSFSIRLPQKFVLPEATSNNMSVLILSDNLSEGCEVSVQYNGMSCGAGVIDNIGRTGIAVWGDDVDTKIKEGPAKGDFLTLAIWDPESQSVRSFDYEIIMGSLTYSVDGLAVIKINSASVTVPTDLHISGVFPNPFNETTVVHFNLPRSSEITVRIYDLSGRMVNELTSDHFQEGAHSISFNAQGLSTGTYILRIETPDQSRAAKMLLIR